MGRLWEKRTHSPQSVYSLCEIKIRPERFSLKGRICYYTYDTPGSGKMQQKFCRDLENFLAAFLPFGRKEGEKCPVPLTIPENMIQ